MPRMVRKIVQGNPIPILNMYYDEVIDRAVTITNDNPIPTTLGNSAAIDPFGRLRVSMPFTLFDSKQLWDKSPLYWDEQITNNSGSATSVHSTVNACTKMSVGLNDTIIRQTFQKFNYQPGKGQRIEMTFNLNGGQANVAKKIGIFDTDNGIFLMLNAANLYFVIRKEGVADIEVLQDNWNLDKLDGTGGERNSSGLELDLSTVKIMIIDFEWLGAGRVRVGFIIGGEIIYCHEFLNSNIIESVYMSTPNLPLRYSIEAANTGEQGVLGTLDHICCAVTSEGGIDPNGKIFGVDTGVVVNLATQNTIYGMLAIRLRTTHLDLITEIINYATFSTSQGVHYSSLWLNPTITGSWTFNNFNTTYSGVEIADGGNGVVITGGVPLHRAILAGGSIGVSVPLNKRWLGSSLSGTRDIIAVGIRPLSNNQDCAAVLNWREE